MGQEFKLIAKTFMGLESVLAEELTNLGANNIEIGRRMVSFTGDKEMMYRANMQLHTAIRILKPIKEFKALSADDVYEQVKAIDWSDYIGLKSTFAVDSVVFSEEFKHSKFVAYKVKDASQRQRHLTGHTSAHTHRRGQGNTVSRLQRRESAPSRLSSGECGSTPQRSPCCGYYPYERMARRDRLH